MKLPRRKFVHLAASAAQYQGGVTQSHRAVFPGLEWAYCPVSKPADSMRATPSGRGMPEIELE
jgi:hypothetical protein